MPCKKKLLEVIFEVTGLISVTYHFISFSNQQSATLQKPDLISIYMQGSFPSDGSPCYTQLPKQGKNQADLIQIHLWAKPWNAMPKGCGTISDA